MDLNPHETVEQQAIELVSSLVWFWFCVCLCFCFVFVCLLVFGVLVALFRFASW